MTYKELEKSVESHFVKLCAQLNFIQRKFKSTIRGVNDRLLIIPGKPAKFLLVELKRPKGGRISPSQKAEHERMREAGVRVCICSTKAEVDELLNTEWNFRRG